MHSTTQHNRARHSTTRHNALIPPTQHAGEVRTAQHNTTQPTERNTSQHGTAHTMQRSTAHSTTDTARTSQHSTARTAQRSAAQHAVPRNSTAQHNTTQHSNQQQFQLCHQNCTTGISETKQHTSVVSNSSLCSAEQHACKATLQYRVVFTTNHDIKHTFQFDWVFVNRESCDQPCSTCTQNTWGLCLLQ